MNQTVIRDFAVETHFIVKGIVNDEASLPPSPAVGDSYFCAVEHSVCLCIDPAPTWQKRILEVKHKGVHVFNQFNNQRLTWSGTALEWVIPKFATEHFAGDAQDYRAITGLGFKPRTVFIYPSSDAYQTAFYLKTDQDYAEMAGALAGGAWVYSDELIKSLDDDGFTVGNGSGMNAMGYSFVYVAVG